MERRRRKSNKRQLPQVNSPFNARKGKGFKLALIITGVIVLILAVLAAAVWLGWITIPGISPDVPENTAPVETVPDTVIRFVAGGDVNVTDNTVAAGEAETGYDYSKVFLDVMPVLSGADLTALNFEGNLCGEPYGSQYASAPQQLVQALHDAGVDILQTANSYSILDGHQSLVSTIQGIRGAGMTPLGTFESKADFQESGGYIIWEIQGIKVAMMAFTKGMVDQEGKPMGLPAVSEGCVNLLYEDYDSTYQKVNTDGITQVVRNAAAHDPDVMIALVHWGSEESDQVSKSQKKICTLLQEEGVDAIIGTHSHYVQKMEHDPASGNFVAWSLGDFYGDMIGTNYSVLLDLEITQDGATGETKVTGFDYVPIYLEENEDGTMRVLRIEEAVLGYENRYLDRVSEETYKAMKTALERIKSRVGK